MPHSSAPERPGLEEYQRLLALLDERRFEEAQIRGRMLLESGSTGLLVTAKTHNLLCWSFAEGVKRPAPEAVLHGEEAVHLARSLGDRSLQVQALFNLASACFQLSHYESARAAYQEIRALLTENPMLLPCGEILALQGLAQVDLARNLAEEALSLLDRAHSLCQTNETRFLQAETDRRRALCLLRLHRADEAAQVLAGVDERASAGARTLWWRTHLLYTRARVELALGHWGSARPLVQNTLSLARELGDLPVIAECTCLLALLEQAEGRKEANRRARAALTYAIQSGRRDVVEETRDRLRTLLSFEL